MKLIVCILALLAGTLQTLRAQMWTESDGAAPGPVELVDKLNNQVPLDAKFRDEDGKEVQLGDYVKDRPVALILVWYKCTSVCSMTFDAAVRSFNDSTKALGKDYEVVTISLSPKEAYTDAVAKKADVVKFYAKANGDSSWHFLVGDRENIDKVAESVGFRFRFHELKGTVDHPSGMVLLTSGGKVSSYLYGNSFAGKDFDSALAVAAGGKVKQVQKKPDIPLYCIAMYDPTTGKYTLLIDNLLKITGIFTVIFVAGGVLWLSLSKKNKNGMTQGGAAHRTQI